MNWIRSIIQRSNSIHNQILFFILLFLIIPLFISTYWIDKPLERIIEQKIGKSTEEALHQVDFNIELFLQEMLKSAVDISTNTSINDMLKRPETYTYYEKLRLNDTVINKLYTSYFTEAHVTLLDMHGNWLSNRYVQEELYNDYIQSNWYKELMKEPFGIKWIANNRNNYLYYDKGTLLTLVKTITDVQTYQNIGMLLFSVNESDISKYLKQLEGEAAIIDHEGNIITSSIRQGQASMTINPDDIKQVWDSAKGQLIVENDQNKWIVSYNTISVTGWKLVQYIPHEMVFKEIYDLRKANMATIAIIVLVFMMLAFSISYRMSKPIKLLNKRMKEIEKNDFNSSLHMSGPKEISTLIDTYNHMARQIRDLLQRLKEEYYQKEEMRFRALQAQMNPHFILNTLNNIKWMAYIRNDREVGEMLSSLGSIMEASIGRGETIITLQEELEYAKHYITLMKLRYNDKLAVYIDIPEELLRQEIIKFTLQPIIENSIIHGIEELNRLGEIRIWAAKAGDHVIIRVADNGAGMSPEKVEQINQNLSEGNNISGRIGLFNVHERLRLQYGEDYGLWIESNQAEGTKVTIVLPIKTL